MAAKGDVGELVFARFIRPSIWFPLLLRSVSLSRPSRNHVCHVVSMASCALGAFVTIFLVWPVANAYAPLSLNTGVRAQPSLGSTRRHTALTQRKPRAETTGTRPSCVDSSSIGGSSETPLGGSVSRGQFLGGLVASSAVLIACASTASAATLSAGDGAARRTGGPAQHAPFLLYYAVYM